MQDPIDDRARTPSSQSRFATRHQFDRGDVVAPIESGAQRP